MSPQTDRLDEHSGIPKRPPVSESFVPEPLLDSDQAAAIMRIHPKTLQKLARRGVIRGLHIGKLWRFRASALEEWIARQMAMTGDNRKARPTTTKIPDRIDSPLLLLSDGSLPH